MEQHKANLQRRGKTLAADSATRMSQPPRRAGYDDWGSDFQSKGSSAARNTKHFSTLASEDSFTLDDSFDELDFLGSQQRRDLQKPKASSSKLRASPIQESDKEVSFFVDGHRYKPHPDYQHDGKRSLQTLKFKKNKKDGDESKPSTSSVGIQNPRNAPNNTAKPPTRQPTQPKPGPARDEPVRRPFKPPTRVSKVDSSRRSNSPPAKKKSSIMSQLDEDYDKTPRASKVHPRPVPVKASVPVPLFKEDTPPTLWGVTEEEERREKGKARAAPWPMDDMSPLKESMNTNAKPDCPLDQISPLKETNNARKNVRPFPLDKKPPAKGENDAAHPKDKKKTLPIPSGSHGTDKLSSFRPVQSFPDLSPLSSPAKPPSSSTQGSQRSSQASQGRKGEKGKAKASRRRVVESSDESQSETDSIQSRNNIRPFPLGTQVLDSIRNTSVKRGSSDGELGSPSVEKRQKKRARGADEMCVSKGCIVFQLINSRYSIRELMHSDGIDDDDDDDLCEYSGMYAGSGLML